MLLHWLLTCSLLQSNCYDLLVLQYWMLGLTLLFLGQNLLLDSVELLHIGIYMVNKGDNSAFGSSHVDLSGNYWWNRNSSVPKMCQNR